MALKQGSTEPLKAEDPNEDFKALYLKQQKEIEELKQRLSAPVKEVKKSEAPVMSTQDMIDAIVKSMAKVTAAKETASGPIAIENLDPADFVDPGVIFFSFGFLYIVNGDRRMGRVIQSPYGNEIKFTHAVTKKTGQGKYEEIEMWCCYESKSKKEIEWLRGHSLYDNRIFENANNLDASKNLKAITMAANMNSINQYTDSNVLSQLKARGEKIDTRDTQVWRTRLAQILTDEQVGLETKHKLDRSLAARQEDLMKLAEKGVETDILSSLSL